VNKTAFKIFHPPEVDISITLQIYELKVPYTVPYNAIYIVPYNIIHIKLHYLKLKILSIRS